MYLHWFLSLLILCTKRTHGQIAMSCDEGWELFGCSCYDMSLNRLSWTEAEAECKNKGAHLVSIDSLQELTYVADNEVAKFWIGLNDRVTEGIWSWTDDTVYNFTSWLPYQPNNGLDVYDEEDCVVMSTSILSDTKGWNDVPCEFQNRFMCERTADINGLGKPTVHPGERNVQLEWTEGMECVSHMEVWETSLHEEGNPKTRQWIFSNYETPSPDYAISLYDLEPSHMHRIHMRVVVGNTASPETIMDLQPLSPGKSPKVLSEENQACPVECECEDGWTELLCSCYQMGENIATWGDAEDQCSRIGAHQVSVHSDQEQSFISALSNVLWIGLRKEPEENTYYWSDGSLLDFSELQEDEGPLEEGSGFSGDGEGQIEEGSGFSGDGEGPLEEGSGFSGDGEGPLEEGSGYYGNYYIYDDDEDFYIERQYSAESESAYSRAMNCVKNIRRQADTQHKWINAYCDIELPFLCKKPAKIVSCRTPQTYVEEGEHNSTNIQIRWRTENLCNARFNVTHHNNGITLQSVHKDGGLVLHYQMHPSDTGMIHRLHLNAMLGYHPGQSHSLSLLVKPNHYNSSALY